LQAGWRFSAILTLPWRPRLAAAGATTYVFDRVTGRVVEHIEEWDVEPRKVLKQLLSPAKRPSDNSSAVERFMWSVSKGQPVDAWLAVSQPALLLGVLTFAEMAALRVVGVSNILPGWIIGSNEMLAWTMVLAGVGGELAKRLR